MAGASLTIGLLSFGGILAVWPVLPAAVAAFVLSVAYEGEIYLQNIKGSLKKLFKSRQLERQLAKACMLEHFPLDKGELNQGCPQFFKDYLNQLQLLHPFEHPSQNPLEPKRLNKDSRDRKQQLEKTLVDMEKWFAEQLFSEENPATSYQSELREWLDQKQLRKTIKEKHGSRDQIYKGLRIFCLTAGVFMGLGTTYLLVDAFAVIPWLAVLPASMVPGLIVPMAAIAGVAYSLLVYNAMTDMIGSEIVSKWRKKFSEYKKIEHKIGMGVVLSVMLVLTVALSICTAGTWWTVAKNTPPLFAWMGRMPAFIMLILNPLISGISTWAFNVENVSETLEMADEKIDRVITWVINLPSTIMQGLKGWMSRASAWMFNGKKVSETDEPIHTISIESQNETLLQRLNPFRKIIKTTFDPLITLFFGGHLVSVSATADRMPGVWPIVSMLLAFFNEMVEDYHYFMGGPSLQHKHDTTSMLKERLSIGGGHHHGDDIPAQLLTALFSPLYVLAAAWDVVCSGHSEGFESWEAFVRAVDKEAGVPPEVDVEFGAFNSCFNVSRQPVPSVDKHSDEVSVKGKTRAVKTTQSNANPNVNAPNPAWPIEHAVYRIERYKEKHLQATADCETTKEYLTKLQADLASRTYCTVSWSPRPIKETIDHYGSFFAKSSITREFLAALPQRVLAGEWAPMRT